MNLSEHNFKILTDAGSRGEHLIGYVEIIDFISSSVVGQSCKRGVV